MDHNIVLGAGELTLTVSTLGGSIMDARYVGKPFLGNDTGCRIHKSGLSNRRAASFPLIPFGNRLENNRFRFDNVEYTLKSNTGHDPLSLHGDGWLGKWQLTEAEDDYACLAYRLEASWSPYQYSACQKFRVTPEALTIRLEVVNDPTVALPYGLGHHLFIPLTAHATLVAQASTYWTERDYHLPGIRQTPPEALDFSEARRILCQWLNNGFEGWNPSALASWPEHEMSLTVTADPIFDRYFLFKPNGEYGTDSTGYFCFEPMSHTANGHHQRDLGGLTLLNKGERLAGEVELAPAIHSRQPHDTGMKKTVSAHL